jgi:hypothetical protein
VKGLSFWKTSSTPENEKSGQAQEAISCKCLHRYDGTSQ